MVRQGYARLRQLSGDEPAIKGYGVFRQRVEGRPDYEATVPFVAAWYPYVALPFDNTGGFVTAMAVVNPFLSRYRTVYARIYDSMGNLLQTARLDLPPGRHMAFTLPDRWPVTVDRRGVIWFSGPRGRLWTADALPLLGLRFNPTGAFTTVFVLPRTALRPRYISDLR